MLSKKVLSLILTVGVIGGVSAFQLTHHAIAKSTQDIKVTAYKPSAKVNENGYQIDKYENIESAAWINENEVLTLTRKSEFKNPDSTRMIRYCSIYNLNTKSSKDFKNANIDEFLGISPDNKFVLYAEARNIPKVESQEWKNALASEDLLHKNVKLLNLSTGQITDVNTEKLNSDAQFIWVSKDKILANYFNHWVVIDRTGKVYADGSKVAYVESNDQISSTNNSLDVSIKVIDTKTGDIKEIVKAASLKDKNQGNNYLTIKIKDENGNVKEKKITRVPCISNICWDSTSTALSFTYGSSSDPFNKDNINTYIVTFDK